MLANVASKAFCQNSCNIKTLHVQVGCNPYQRGQRALIWIYLQCTHFTRPWFQSGNAHGLGYKTIKECLKICHRQRNNLTRTPVGYFVNVYQEQTGPESVQIPYSKCRERTHCLHAEKENKSVDQLLDNYADLILGLP